MQSYWHVQITVRCGGATRLGGVTGLACAAHCLLGVMRDSDGGVFVYRFCFIAWFFILRKDSTEGRTRTGIARLTTDHRRQRLRRIFLIVFFYIYTYAD